MTDARIPERYLMDRRIVRLSDTERSSYFMATLWSVSNRTDGYVDSDDVALIPTFKESAIPALVACGLWIITGAGWTDAEFVNVQTSKDDLEVLDNARRADRDKKARLKAHKAGNHDLCKPSTCNESPSFSESPGDVPGERSRGAHRTGEARRGKGDQVSQEPDIDANIDVGTGEVLDAPQPTADWWTAPIPDSVVSDESPVDSTICRECGQATKSPDAWGLCSRISASHVAARKQPAMSAA